MSDKNNRQGALNNANLAVRLHHFIVQRLFLYGPGYSFVMALRKDLMKSVIKKIYNDSPYQHNNHFFLQIPEFFVLSDMLET